MNCSDAYLQLLREELVPATGCTEPIAIAFASASAREALGGFPERITVAASGNVIKNAKSVVIPGTSMRGIDAGAILGALAGDAGLGMEVLSRVTADDAQRTAELKCGGICCVKTLPGETGLHIIVEMRAGERQSLVEIRNAHTNIVKVERDGQAVFIREADSDCDRAEVSVPMTVADIHRFAEQVDLSGVSAVILRQVEYNRRIAQEGLCGDYGVGVGRTLLRSGGADVRNRARAWAAAGSDARMGGCALPVVINSGSGNQGLTVSLPVIAYAEELRSTEEELIRALVLSNLIAIYLKSHIGKLSAYCGVVSAACGSAAGVSRLHGGDLDMISMTIVNTIANVSGMICDGAKSSCAAKIAIAVEAGLLGFELARAGRAFSDGEGLVGPDVDRTIAAFGRMGCKGMKGTDEEILCIMCGD